MKGCRRFALAALALVPLVLGANPARAASGPPTVPTQPQGIQVQAWSALQYASPPTWSGASGGGSTPLTPTPLGTQCPPKDPNNSGFIPGNVANANSVTPGYWQGLPGNVTGPDGAGNYQVTATVPYTGQVVGPFTITPVSVWTGQMQQIASTFGWTIPQGDLYDPKTQASSGATPFAENMANWSVVVDVSLTYGTWGYKAPNGSAATNAQEWASGGGTGSFPPPGQSPSCVGFKVTGWDPSPVALNSKVAVSTVSNAPPLSGVGPGYLTSTYNAGSMGTLPSQATAYVNAPTCAWVTNPGPPNGLPTTPVTVGFTAIGKVPASGPFPGQNWVYAYTWHVITPSPIQWNFHDPSGSNTLNGGNGGNRGIMDAGNQPAAGSYPAYDPVSQSFPDSGNPCGISHSYSAVVASPIHITATQNFTVQTCGAYSNSSFGPPGSTIVPLWPGGFCPLNQTLTMTWNSQNFEVRQMQGVPVIP